MKRIEKMVSDKLSQWDKEAALNARRAKAQGRQAVLVTYPTGLQMMRFAQPFTDFGMHYEVPAEVWDAAQPLNVTTV